MDLVTPELGFIFWILLIGIVIILPIIALISVFSNQFPKSEKLIWILVILFAPFFGSLIYFTLGRSKGISN